MNTTTAVKSCWGALAGQTCQLSGSMEFLIVMGYAALFALAIALFIGAINVFDAIFETRRILRNKP